MPRFPVFPVKKPDHLKLVVDNTVQDQILVAHRSVEKTLKEISDLCDSIEKNMDIYIKNMEILKAYAEQ